MNRYINLSRQYALTRSPEVKEQMNAIVRNYQNKHGYPSLTVARNALQANIMAARFPNGFPGRMQTSNAEGGCWFMGILNGFLLSYRARKLLRIRLQQYKNTNLANFQRAQQAVGPVCPMPGKVNKGLFWAYIDERLKTGSRVLNRMVHMNRLILNLKLRKPGNNFSGGSFLEVDNVIKDLWPEFGTPNSPVITLRYSPQRGHEVPSVLRLKPGYPEYNTNLKNKGTGVYRVSHVMMDLRRMGGGHLIIGYVKEDGTQMLYDSNNVNSIKCNWRTDVECVRQYIIEAYGKAAKGVGITYNVVFIRSDAANTGAPNNNVPIMWPPVNRLPVSPPKASVKRNTITRTGRVSKKPRT
jgi:hypothetical protein